MDKQPAMPAIVVDQSCIVMKNPPKLDSIDIVFENISYTVQVKDQNPDQKFTLFPKYKKKQILNKVSGIFKAGKVTAIMGASGAGKTTLLNIIACRIDPNQGGKLFANNLQYDHQSFGNFANYVMQTDRLMQTLTVRQTLQFAAKLKLNSESKAQQKRKVKQLVLRMKLQNCLDTLVGGIILKGISGGQKKRVSIAFELISDPYAIFLDEPTSGLDSLTSYIIVSQLKKLAQHQNKTVIMTIHQPGSQTFGLFDDLMVLFDGRLIYQNDASLITDYFEKNFNLPCPQFMNPPDYFMSQIHFQNMNNCQRFAEFIEVYEKLQHPKIQSKISDKQTSACSFRNTQVPYLVALKALLYRSMINTLRNPHIIHAKLIQVLLMALYTGGIYFGMGQKDYTEHQTWLSISGFFFCVSIASVLMSIPPVALTFPLQRLVFIKEEQNRMYNTTQYFLARNIMQIPEHILLPIVAIPIYYFMIGCAPTAGQFFLHCLICCLMSFCGGSIGLFIGSVITDYQDIPVVIPIFIMPMLAFSGFFKNRNDLPKWCGWMEYISPNKYSFIALLENEVQHKDSLIDRFNFDLPKQETIWLIVILGVSFRFAALFCLWLFRKRTQ